MNLVIEEGQAPVRVDKWIEIHNRIRALQVGKSFFVHQPEGYSARHIASVARTWSRNNGMNVTTAVKGTKIWVTRTL